MKRLKNTPCKQLEKRTDFPKYNLQASALRRKEKRYEKVTTKRMSGFSKKNFWVLAKNSPK